MLVMFLKSFVYDTLCKAANLLVLAGPTLLLAIMKSWSAIMRSLVDSYIL